MQIKATDFDKANALDLVKVLTIAAIKVKGGKIAELKRDIGNAAYDGALTFIKEYNNDDVALFEKLWTNLRMKSDVVEPITAEMVPVLRAMLRAHDMKNRLDLISTDVKEMLTPLLAYFADPTSLNKLDVVVRKSSLLREPALTNKLISVFKELSDSIVDAPATTPMSTQAPATNSAGTETMKQLLTQITVLGKQITGRNNVTKLTLEEKAKYNEIPANKPLIREFNSLRSQLTNVKKNEIRNIVAKSGQQRIPVRDMVKALIADGNKSFAIPKGLQKSTIVYINMNGEYCDKDGRICAKQTADPTAIWEDNPRYSPTGGKGKMWLVKVTTASGDNYYGVKERIAQNRAARFEKIDQVLQNGIEKAKSAWREDMSGGLDNENTIFANIAEYLFWTASRVGAAEGKTANERTYGASNFLVKHITDLTKGSTSPSRLTLRYPVKSGAEITFVLSSNVGDLPNKGDVAYMKKLINFIARKAQGKKPDDVVFTVKGKRIDTDDLNRYLSSKLGAGFTGKDFRTLRGTDLAIVALDSAGEEFANQNAEAQKKGKKLPQKTVDALFDAAMLAVGELLGHVRRSGDDGEEVTTSSTAIRAYCNPKVMRDWYVNCGYQPSARVISACRSAGVEV